mmetsp:Transcript_26057/g.48567  ORF Transcript_26057/g.48567 Transcript_26057/m.48567 type:complete len:246 (-) Transcript_26057:481-1218(-)
MTNVHFLAHVSNPILAWQNVHSNPESTVWKFLFENRHYVNRHIFSALHIHQSRHRFGSRFHLYVAVDLRQLCSKTSHVLNYSQNVNPYFFTESDLFSYIRNGYGLGCAHHNSSINASLGQMLCQGYVLIRGSWWSVYDEEIQRPPIYSLQKLLYQPVLPRATPHNCVIRILKQKSHRHHQDSIIIYDRFPAVIALMHTHPRYTKHHRNRRPTNVDVQNSDLVSTASQILGQTHRYSTFSDASFPR